MSLKNERIKNEIQSDAEVMELLSRICHHIAYETDGDTSENDMNRLSDNSRDQLIQQLFTLTDNSTFSDKIATLAESFGLMLVKLETREFRQRQLIEELQEKNDLLEKISHNLGEKNRSLTASLRKKYHPAQFVGHCPEMQRITKLAMNIARRPINTLILGASGTGKEIFAKIIHYNSSRGENPFVAINCTAIPDSLFESEMFGIEKGVATGVNRRQGFFEQAHTGTVFLDEIGDMSLPNQAKLLRVLEERQILRVGGNQTIDVDITLISATNANLKNAVDEGHFREDLYYRLNVVELSLPLLKDRGEDIVILAEKLLSKHCKAMDRNPLFLSKAARRALSTYDWPGNVRELNNEMERIAALTFADFAEVEDLSPKLQSSITNAVETASISHGSSPKKGEAPLTENDNMLDETSLNLEQIQKETILKALDRTNGNKTKAAELLGITREGLRKKILRYENDIGTG